MDNEWLQHPVTKEVRKALEDRRYQLMLYMAQGATLSSEAETTLSYTARTVGEIAGLTEAIDLMRKTDESNPD